MMAKVHRDMVSGLWLENERFLSDLLRAGLISFVKNQENGVAPGSGSHTTKTALTAALPRGLSAMVRRAGSCAARRSGAAPSRTGSRQSPRAARTVASHDRPLSRSRPGDRPGL